MPSGPLDLPPDTTLVSQLRRHARERGHEVAVTFLENGEDVESKITYAELHASALRVAAGLRARAEPGARVVLGYPNGLEFLVAFFACQYAGMIPVPIAPPRLRGRTGDLERMQSILHNADAAVLLTSERIRAKQSNDGAVNAGWLVLEELEGGDSSFTGELPSADSIAFLQYTSGSTTNPRGVMVTHAGLVANIGAIGQAMGVEEGARFMGWLPLHHDMGLIGIALHALLRGDPLVLMTPTHFVQRPSRWLAAMSRYRATFSGAPNFAYDMCVQRSTEAERQSLDLRHWQTAFNGAEPVRAATLDAFARTFAPCGFARRALFPCYGLAESTLYVSGARLQEDETIVSFDAAKLALGEVAPPQGSTVRLVSCGESPPGHHVRLVDPQSGTPVREGAIGEIWVSGPSVARGYWRAEEATAATFHARLPGEEGEYLRTGDLGFVRNGALFVTGRLKDLLIVRGRNIYPQDLEHTVAGCCEALLAGSGAAFLDALEGDEHLVIVQELRNGVRLDLSAIMEDIAERLVEVHEVQPHRIVLIGAGSLPKTSSGKVRRSAARDALRAGLLPVIAELRRDAPRARVQGTG